MVDEYARCIYIFFRCIRAGNPKYILYTFLPDVQRRAVPLNLTAPL